MVASVSRPCHGRWVPTVSCRVLCHPTGRHRLQTRSKTHAPAVCVCATCAYKQWSWNPQYPPQQQLPCPRGSLLSSSSPDQVGSILHPYPFNVCSLGRGDCFSLYTDALKGNYKPHWLGLFRPHCCLITALLIGPDWHLTQYVNKDRADTGGGHNNTI